METIKDIRQKAYVEMFMFIDWFAKKYGNQWEKLCNEFIKENEK